MTEQSSPAPTGTPPGRPSVALIALDLPTLRALADADLAGAERAAGLSFSPIFVCPAWRRTWRLRQEQVEADPDISGWVTAVIWDVERGVAAGRAGFHGPPDGSGLVEVGYAVDPAHRRRGYARSALEVLLARAVAEPRVRVVRASVGPQNLASRKLIESCGFVEVGEQFDHEDGLEIVYERPARQR